MQARGCTATAAVLAMLAIAAGAGEAAAAARPDLAVTRITAPAGVAAGATISIPVAFANKGTATARAARLEIFLATGNRPVAAVKLTASAKIGKLARRKKGKRTIVAVVPPNVVPGTYRLFVCARPAKKPRDRKKGNDCRSAALAIAAPQPGIAPLPPPMGPLGPAPSDTGTGTPTPPPPTTPPDDNPDPPPPPPEPPDPDAGVPAESAAFLDGVDFLFEGADAVQQDVVPGTIERRLVAVLRGTVVDTDGEPLPGVRIDVLDHPEYGYTQSQTTGGFDMVVNGGGDVTLTFAKDGFLPSQRTLAPGWREYELQEPVALVALSPLATEVEDTSTELQVVQGEVESDHNGERQSTLLFPPGADPQLQMPNGTTQPLDGPMHVRATEYTVGPGGDEAMPGELPPTSGYTYAAEFSIDEAMEAGATSVEFAEPVISYTENFIGAPVGSRVPAGWYDRGAGRWVPGRDGRVIEIVSETDGKADVNVDEVAGADTGQPLTDLGIDDAEREKLAGLYEPGTQLWRLALDHFTPWDFNWPFGPPKGIKPFEIKPFVWKPPDDPCPSPGSLISCETQTLGETVPVTGSALSLNHTSDRQPGYEPGRTVDVKLTGDELDPLLKGIIVHVQVAGREVYRYWKRSDFDDAEWGGIAYPDLEPNLRFTMGWDGLDAYGRPVLGSVMAKVSVAQIYDELKYVPEEKEEWEASFGQTGTGQASRSFPGGGSCIDPNSFHYVRSAFCGIAIGHAADQVVGSWNARSVGLAGWTLDQHHFYDAGRQQVWKGDGSAQSATEVPLVLDTFAGGGNTPITQNPAPIAESTFNNGLGDMDVAPDGTVFAHVGSNDNRIVRIDPDGTVRAIAGTGARGAPTGDGGPASAAVLGDGLWDLEATPDGSVYMIVQDSFANGQANYIRRIAPDGTISTVAGRSFQQDGGRGEGGPATAAKLGFMPDLEIASDGTIYFAERQTSVPGIPAGFPARVGRIAPDGRISTYAGAGGTNDPDEDLVGVPARDHVLGTPNGLALAPDGSVYLGDLFGDRVLKIDPDGILARFAGGSGGSGGDGGPARSAGLAQPKGILVLRDGTVVIRHTPGSADILRAVSSDGTIRTVAGGTWGTCQAPEDGMAAARACVGFQSDDVVELGDGTLLYTDGDHRIRSLAPPLASLDSAGSFTIPSADGAELWEFNAGGRHLRTRDAITGSLLWTFEYDDSGRLTAAEDGDGNRTTVSRDRTAKTITITAPGGEATQLAYDAGGFATSITDAGGSKTVFTPDDGGLLSSFALPGRPASTFEYDDLGRLTRDEGPSGLVQTLSREETEDTLTVTRETGGGYATVYSTEMLGDGSRTRTVTEPDGATSMTVSRPDGSFERVELDASSDPGDEVITRGRLATDPRFAGATYVAEQTTTTPSGLVREEKAERTVQLATPDDLLSVTLHKHRRERRLADGTWAWSETTYSNDAGDRELRIRSFGDRNSLVQLDAQGRALTFDADTTTSANAVTAYTYDAQGRMTSISAGGRTVHREWSSDRLTAVHDGGTRRLEFGYDASGELISRTLPGGATYTYERDAAGDVLAVVTPEGGRHETTRDGAGAVTSFSSPGDPAPATRTFGTDRRVTSVASPGGATTAPTYDGAGRFTGTTSPDGAMALEYDSLGRIAASQRKVADLALQRTVASYDGDLATGAVVTGPAAYDASWTYENGFDLASERLASAGGEIVTAWDHDGDGAVVEQGTFTYTRGAAARATSKIAGAGLELTLTRTPTGRVAKRSFRVGDAAPFYEEETTVDAVGLIDGRTETVDGTQTVTHYEHTLAGRLSAVTRGDATLEAYAYDDNGNRTARTLAGITQEASFGADDRMLTQGPLGLDHDADGNVTGIGDVTLTHAPDGRLLTATRDGTTVSYGYDSHGRRTSRTAGGHTQGYVYGDPEHPYRLTGSISPSGALTRYFYDDDGLLFAIERADGTRFFVGTDHLGSPRVVVDSSGAEVARYDHDAYGVPTATSDTVFDLPIGFAGGLRDTLSGLVRFGLRDYAPVIGRFVQRDPSSFGAGELNLYTYAQGSPQNLVDPTGTRGCTKGSMALPNGFFVEVQHCTDDEGKKSTCAALGANFGSPSIGYSHDPNGEVQEEAKASIFAEATVKNGPLEGTVGVEIDITDPCGWSAKGSLKASTPFYEAGIDTSGKIKSAYKGKNKPPSPGWGASAKAGARACSGAY